MNAKTKKNDPAKKGDITLSQAELTLRDEIVQESKNIALQKTSSAFALVQKTRELLKLESMRS